MKKIISLIFVLSMLIIVGCGDSQPKEKQNKQTKKEVKKVAKTTEPAQKNIELPAIEGTTHFVIHTDFGDMRGVLYDATPKHRDNFIKLAKQNFFDNLLFHRVIDGFMIQGGDPESRNAESNKMLGNGGPGYTIPAEFDPLLIHKKGVLSAARMPDNVNPQKESSGSQFYVVQGKPYNADQINSMCKRTKATYLPEQIEYYQKVGGTPFLDNQYTVFGEITDGLEIIDRIAKVKTNRSDRPLEDVKMRVEIID